MDATKMAEVTFNTSLESTSDPLPYALHRQLRLGVLLALGR